MAMGEDSLRGLSDGEKGLLAVVVQLARDTLPLVFAQGLTPSRIELVT
jgi:hypothetical protein